MDSTREAAVVFQIRWAPEPSETGDLPPSFDKAVSGLQGWDTGSNLSGTKKSVKSDGLYTNQGRAQFESSQRVAHQPLHASLDSESFLSLVEPLDIEFATYLRGKYISDEPWNPLAALKIAHGDISTQTTHSNSYHAGSKLGNSITYHTAKSEIFHTATSGSGRRINAIIGTFSE